MRELLSVLSGVVGPAGVPGGKALEGRTNRVTPLRAAKIARNQIARDAIMGCGDGIIAPLRPMSRANTRASRPPNT